MAEKSLAKPSVIYEIELRERMVRVEEELKHQRELMKEGFEMMNKRFEQMDKRFKTLTTSTDRFMVWSFEMTIATTGLIISAFMFWH